jgi:phospholipid-binding lipoprotein MlaA
MSDWFPAWGGMVMQQRVFGLILVAVMAAGCTTSSDPEAIAQNDPYETYNRDVFDINMKVDKAVAKPVAKFYNHAVPQVARNGVHNLLVNLNKPVTFGNDLLQGEPSRAGQTLGRFAINSTIGVVGIVDVASMIGIPDHTEDFGQTLAVWGAGEGPYLMLPFLGPDPPRDLAGDVGDMFMDPLTYIRFHGSDTWSVVRGGVSVLDMRARNVDNVEQIERTSIDFYATTRSLYRQYRNSEIRNGAPDPSEETDTPDF